MVNPYLCYAFSFTIGLLTYSLGWSDLYPQLSFSLLLFILITICIHAIIGVKIVRQKIIVFKRIELRHHWSPLIITIFLYCLWSLEFVYEGGIPLLKILLKQPYNYRLFGIPSLHVFIVTFSSFYTVYLFHCYLSSRQKFLLFLYLINLFAAILIYSRAMFFFNLTASFFLLLLSVRKISSHLFYIIPLSVLLLFYFFGVLGTLRVSREAGKTYDNSLFLQIGKAERSFVESPVPKELFWSYIYISSPMANLQNNINTYSLKSPTVQSVLEMINNEICMDFISKRVNAFFNIERENENTIPGPFNVSTVYSRAYSYLGWYGMFVMLITTLIVPLIYIKLIPFDSPFFLTGLTILSTMFLFLAYDNTIRFTGLSFQLVYPIILHLVVRRSNWMQKLFT